jgi:hypothetical protein
MLTPPRSTMPPPWALYAWPAILCQANDKRKARFTHLGTRVTSVNDGGRAGQTVWTEHLDEGEAGIAWDWIEIADGVVAMANPLCVLTNLRLVGDMGELLPARESALHLSRLVCQLPWQDEVWRAASVHAAA